MLDIFSYTDYRKFLKDYFEKQKAENKGFTYDALSQMVGVKSRGFIHNLVAGKRNVTNPIAFKLADAMGLGKQETEYFIALVSFNQAKNLTERNHLFEKLTSTKAWKKQSWSPQLIRENQYEFYSKFHHSVTRTLIALYDFKEDYDWLARNVSPRITPAQARKSVELLDKLGLIKKDKNGKYKVTEKTLSTEDEVMSLALVNFHLETMKLALRATADLPREKRNISGTTLGISKKAYDNICKEIQKFRFKIQKIAEDDEDSTNVYRLNFQFFPVSEPKLEGSTQ